MGHSLVSKGDVPTVVFKFLAEVVIQKGLHVMMQNSLSWPAKDWSVLLNALL
jgi:hypothetical protein